MPFWIVCFGLSSVCFDGMSCPSNSLETMDSILYHIDVEGLLDIVPFKVNFPRRPSGLHLWLISEGEFLSNHLQRGANLHQLFIHFCPNLTSLLEWIGNITSLSNLEIMNGSDLASLPELIGNLPSLAKLGIYYCPELTSLPKEISHVQCSVHLNILRTYPRGRHLIL